MKKNYKNKLEALSYLINDYMVLSNPDPKDTETLKNILLKYGWIKNEIYWSCKYSFQDNSFLFPMAIYYCKKSLEKSIKEITKENDNGKY